MKAIRTMLAALCLLALGCGGREGRTYDNSDLVLASHYAAKETCSCIFVMEQTEEYCRNWTRANPAVATTRIDYEEKTVESAAILFWGTRARFTGDDFGCVLE